LALLSIKKIKAQDAIFYVIAQVVGALIAMLVGQFLTGEGPVIDRENILSVGFGEALGAFILAFGVSAAVYQRVKDGIAGVIVGGSLFLGIYLALPLSNAVLNPAVAIGIGSFTSMYLLGPIVGAVAGCWLFTYLWGEKVKFSK
jgi:glycerol uptake facilitator-like aquaporin